MLAVSPQKRERLLRILEGHRIVCVANSHEAIYALENDGFGLVVLGVHFDESQMFAVLGDIRHHGRYRKVPIVVVLSRIRFPLSEVIVEGLDHASKALGANGFLDLDAFPDNEEGNGRIRRIIDYLILIDGDLHRVAEEAGDPAIKNLVERHRAPR